MLSDQESSRPRSSFAATNGSSESAQAQDAQISDDADGCAADKFNAFLTSANLDFNTSSPLAQALIHRSYASEQNNCDHNERLEILGDAVVGLLVIEGLYQRHPQADEGELSRRRASLVSRHHLGQIGQQLGLGALIRLGKGEGRTGGRTRSSNLGSCLEAVVGAIYLERGLETCRQFVELFVLPHDNRVSNPNDAKSRLQEIVQRTHQQQPRYETIDSQGPDHDRTYVVQVWVGDEVMGQGEGRRIKTAENAAACEALVKLEQMSDGRDDTSSPPSVQSP